MSKNPQNVGISLQLNTGTIFKVHYAICQVLHVQDSLADDIRNQIRNGKLTPSMSIP
jgi:hypothetical protein